MNGEIEAQLAVGRSHRDRTGSDLYSYGMNYGEATFATFCSQCHGSGAAGANGYPNLLDNDWLWGGDDRDDRLHDPPRHPEHRGRGQRPLLGDAGLRGARGYYDDDNCAPATWKRAPATIFLGAPNLTDAIWLYGDNPKRPSRHSVTQRPLRRDAAVVGRCFGRRTSQRARRSVRSPSTSIAWVAASRPRPTRFRQPLPVAGPAPVPVLFARFLRDRCLP
jgi:hypothetical protein